MFYLLLLFFFRQLQVLFIRNWCACATMIVTTTPTRRSPSSALVATSPAGTTTSCRLHLLANRAVIWHQIWGSLHKMTCSTPCSPNLTPQRERSRASPTKTVPSVSIRSRKYVGSSCKTSKDALQVCIQCLFTFRSLYKLQGVAHEILKNILY